ncbi:MAG: exonuclease domain-containing protein [Rhodospirillales bacterium]|nr:exonuclease domain-containing protein [Rhodospirillales bacterium]
MSVYLAILAAIILLVEGGVATAMFMALWNGLGADTQAALATAANSGAGILILGGLVLAAVPVAALITINRRYVTPLPKIAEATRVVAMSNPRHRIPIDDAPSELRDAVAAVNLLADRFEASRQEVEDRIREANTALEEERNTLAALMSKLTQGVVVCNPTGQILLYNHLAQTLLSSGAAGGEWIGLGRSVFTILDQKVVEHALDQANHRLSAGDAALLVPFVANRPGGQMLSVHLVPIPDAERRLRGYILTLEDVTRRSDSEQRRGKLLHSLIQGQRSSLASIRAAIEIVLSNPDLVVAERQQFLDVISDEATRLGDQLDGLEREYAADLKVNWLLEEMLGTDLLAAIGRSVTEKTKTAIEVTAPLEPVWLRVDSYAIAQVVVFLVERIQPLCRAEGFGLHLEARRNLAALVLDWNGAPLNMEALRNWWDRSVISESAGRSLTLFDVIERHGGATWAHAAAGRRPAVQIVLPAGEAAGQHLSGPADDMAGPDFDFRLFAGGVAGGVLDDTPLSKLHYTVLDTETTGLDPAGGDEIIAIGAVRIVNGRILKRETFDVLVNPRRVISRESQAIHGISPAMLRTMPGIEDVLPKLARFVEDSVIVGHNIAFDMRFLAKKEAETGVKFTNPVLDTLLLELIAHPNIEDKSLEAIAGRLGITITGRHTALGDAMATAEVFLALLPMLAEKGISTLGTARRACEQHALMKMTG